MSKTGFVNITAVPLYNSINIGDLVQVVSYKHSNKGLH